MSEETVIIGSHWSGRSSYHTDWCYHAKQLDNPIETTVSEAQKRGLVECKACSGDEKRYTAESGKYDNRKYMQLIQQAND